VEDDDVAGAAADADPPLAPPPDTTLSLFLRALSNSSRKAAAMSDVWNLNANVSSLGSSA